MTPGVQNHLHQTKPTQSCNLIAIYIMHIFNFPLLRTFHTQTITNCFFTSKQFRRAFEIHNISSKIIFILKFRNLIHQAILNNVKFSLSPELDFVFIWNCNMPYCFFAHCLLFWTLQYYVSVCFENSPGWKK